MRRIRKGVRFLHGRSRFAKKFVEVKDVTDKRFLEMLLMQSERAWSCAMECKEDESNPRARFHTLRRLKKAVLWSEHLVSICESCADDRTQLEAQAYCAWMKRNELFELEKWQEFIVQSTKCKTIYEQLGKIVHVDQVEYYSVRVEELTALFKYALSKSDASKGMVDCETIRSMMTMASDDPALRLLQGKLGTIIEATQRQRADQVTEIKWQGKSIVLKSPALKLAFVKAIEITSELERLLCKQSKGQVPNEEKTSNLTSNSSTTTSIDDDSFNQSKSSKQKIKSESLGQRLNAFDRLLSAWSKAKLKIRDERALALQNKQSESTLEDLGLLMSYAVYSEQSQMMIRNLIFVGSIEKKIDSIGLDNLQHVKPDEAVRLYEIILQLLTENEQLRVSGQEKETNKEAKALVDGREMGYKALRCYYLALTYLQVSKWPEAAALMKKSLEYAELSQRFLMVNHISLDQKLTRRCANLNAQVRSAMIWMQAKSVLESIAAQKPEQATTSTQQETSKTANILSDLKSWDASFAKERIIDFPPAPEPMAAKPVLFDLAFSGFETPNLVEKAKAPKIGFFSSFWGR